jgi:hypothetical protein
MTCPNPDRLQLMCLARAIATTPDAMGLEPYTSASRPTTCQPEAKSLRPAPCEHAGSTSAGEQSDGGRATLIERRASRLRFPNEVQRQRYISRHSAGFSTGDAQ